MRRQLAAQYIRENFEPTDRLAVVLLQKRTGTLIQRLARSEKLASNDFQAWLRHKNAEQYEIYVSMNALHENATGRTKSDVATVRHVYLDFDDNGTGAVEKLLRRQDLPQPNYLVNSSPDKWQVVWKVEGFTKDQAEQLQRGLVSETGADPAATDCSRVLRLPGFYNHKYAKQHFVDVQSLSKETYRPERFPALPAEERSPLSSVDRTIHDPKTKTGSGKLSQSERDWAYAKRALAQGESEAAVIATLAALRTDKYNPQYYAELTVRKAAATLTTENGRITDKEVPHR
jgi:hypothetical protein